MDTGEDIQGLRKIIDFTRLLSIFVLAIHFYSCCYQAFAAWGLTAGITDRLIANIAGTGLFDGFWRAKLGALLLLVVSLVAVKGKKDEKILLRNAIFFILVGALLYFSSTICFLFMGPGSWGSRTIVAAFYIGLTSTGYLLMLTGGGQLSRLLKDRLNKDIFNEENETFPQEERLLENEYSVNLPARYRLGKVFRESWINIINPFRGLLVAGTPGAGKSYFVDPPYHRPAYR
ncbi:YWFCY domain-containing protein [Pedobacter sp. UC225_65]|uniref:YWFCY domain-containing protein n=1 Tax=Pedobacter sp. UC225_65 TaxID=3350173 RepID=UPI00366C709E